LTRIKYPRRWDFPKAFDPEHFIMDKIYDLIIIGAGPAGITASVYAARKQMDFLIITEDIGGQTAWSGDIENYTGYQFITGIDLTVKFEEHLKKYITQHLQFAWDFIKFSIL